MRGFLRRLRLLRGHRGFISAWTDPEGRIIVGHMCECGTIHGWTALPECIFPPYLRKENLDADE